MVIWKFPLLVTHQQSIALPGGAQVLHIGVQNNGPCMWVLLDPSLPKVQRDFFIIGTGTPVGDGIRRHYLGTFQLDMGGQPFVGHVFELGL